MESLFRNPWLLPALAALLLPPLIEWLFRRRKKQVELPTIRFLLNNQEQKKVKRQDRILLLLRMLAIGLVVFGVARPLWQRGWMGAAPDRNVTILLDGTGSMSQQRDVSVAFAMAQKKAAAVARALPAGTPVTVLLLGHRLEVVLENETDLHTAAARIEGLRPTSGAAPMATALAWVRDHTADQQERSELYVFSDFQKHTWIQAGSAAAPALLTGLEEKCETFLIDVGGEHAFNYVATQLRPEEFAMSAGMPVTFQTLIECRGTPPADAKASVTFLVDGVKKDVREVTPGEQPVVLEFAHRFPAAAEYLVEVVVEGDNHRLDNRRMYLCRVPEEVQVLLLDETADGPAEPQSLFLARSIRPPTHAALEKVSHFQVKTIVPARISYENLSEYAAILLTGTRQLTPGLAAQLETYAADGGSLWMFMGDTVNLYDYNRLLYRDGEGVMPCALAEKVAPQDAAANIYPQYGDSNHPALVQLARLASDDQTAVLKYVHIDSQQMAASAQVVVSLSNGEPAIVERPFGRGRSLLLNTSADAGWSRLPALAEFAILVQELLRYVVGEPDAAVNLNVGETFEQPVYISTQHLLLRYPDGSKERLRPRRRSADQDEFEVLFDNTTQQGLYEIETIEEVLPRRRFVVNPSAAESDLSRLSQADFRETFPAGGWSWIGSGVSVADMAADLHTVTEISPWIFGALAAMLAIETLLAWRFGRRRGLTA
ncbi:BatA domain-containing protein [Lignipirellula cremea]|uniref:VWFA domain-containing protein n=1 Tax=Lignipirellula cremea TaxID=2528010 RepID=A0A518DWC1_9BACT|nr:BatA domain-containing protein [Lignipirellula cremea]QDU96135.1 hypothetical protein Pla8534_39540 [Lignipirellula cremea]